VSGVALEVPVRNQLAALRLVNPRAVRIGVLYTAADSARYAEEAVKAAPVLRLVVTARAVQTPAEVGPALQALLAGPAAVDALWLPADPLLLAAETRRLVLAETLAARRAVYAAAPELVGEGALASVAPDLSSIGSEAAVLVDRLAGGERDISLRAPRAELVVSPRTAERLGVEIPEATLESARKQ
jgi:ABC-type uncharacterized transport system substrate-binding protein